MSQATAQSNAEKRAHDRIDHRVAVTVTSESNFYTGFTQDISEGGVFVATPDLLPIGAMVEFELALGGGKGTVTVRGEVRWVRELSEYNPDAPPGFGVRFTNLHPKVADIINAFIDARRDSMFYDDDL